MPDGREIKNRSRYKLRSVADVFVLLHFASGYVRLRYARNHITGKRGGSFTRGERY